MEELDNQIEKTKEILEEEAFEGKWVPFETLLVLENQLVILETLKKLL